MFPTVGISSHVLPFVSIIIAIAVVIVIILIPLKYFEPHCHPHFGDHLFYSSLLGGYFLHPQPTPAVFLQLFWTILFYFTMYLATVHDLCILYMVCILSSLFFYSFHILSYAPMSWIMQGASVR